MNVRWDSVVDCVRQMEPEGQRVAREPPSGFATAGEPVIIKVWLYGTLASDRVERPIQLELGGDFTVAAVICELGRRLGEDFLRQVIDAEGRKFNQCLVFVDGVKVDANVMVRRGAASVHVEMILLPVIEGG